VGRISFQKRQEEMERQEKMKVEKGAQRKIEKSGQPVSPSEAAPEAVKLADAPIPNSERMS